MAEKVKIEEKKNRKRESIIEAASELFSTRNFHEVMMDDVARLASIAKGTLYNYYNSKEDLYFSIMVMRMEKLILSLKEKIATEDSAVGALHTYVIHNYMFMVKYNCFFLMFRKDNLKADNKYCIEFRQKIEDLKELLKNIIDSGKERQLFRNLNTGLTADLVQGSIYSAVERAINNSLQKDSLESERENLFDFILIGVSSLPGSESALRPLAGKKIVITRSLEDSNESASLFTDQGAEVIAFPVLDVLPPEDWAEFDQALIRKFDILIFTSVNAVRMFERRTGEINKAISFDDITVIAIGKKTASFCSKKNIPVSIVPKDFSSQGLIDEMQGHDLKGKTILIPSSALSDDSLKAALEAMGAFVKNPEAYNIGVPSESLTKTGREYLERANPDMFIFTSPSTFRNFLSIMEIKEPLEYFKSWVIAAIGPTTKAEIEKANLTVGIMPSEYTMEGLLEAAIKYYEK